MKLLAGRRQEETEDVLGPYRMMEARRTVRQRLARVDRMEKRRAAERMERRNWRRWWRKMKVRLVLWFLLGGTACVLAGALLMALYMRRLGIVVWIQ